MIDCFFLLCIYIEWNAVFARFSCCFQIILFDILTNLCPNLKFWSFSPKALKFAIHNPIDLLHKLIIRWMIKELILEILFSDCFSLIFLSTNLLSVWTLIDFVLNICQRVGFKRSVNIAIHDCIIIFQSWRFVIRISIQFRFSIKWWCISLGDCLFSIDHGGVPNSNGRWLQDFVSVVEKDSALLGENIVLVWSCYLSTLWQIGFSAWRCASRLLALGGTPGHLGSFFISISLFWAFALRTSLCSPLVAANFRILGLEYFINIQKSTNMVWWPITPVQLGESGTVLRFQDAIVQIQMLDTFFSFQVHFLSSWSSLSSLW